MHRPLDRIFCAVQCYFRLAVTVKQAVEGCHLNHQVRLRNHTRGGCCELQPRRQRSSTSLRLLFRAFEGTRIQKGILGPRVCSRLPLPSPTDIIQHEDNADQQYCTCSQVLVEDMILVVGLWFGGEAGPAAAEVSSDGAPRRSAHTACRGSWADNPSPLIQDSLGRRTSF